MTGEFEYFVDIIVYNTDILESYLHMCLCMEKISHFPCKMICCAETGIL